MNRTKIEWTDGGWTWNPIKMRCTPISSGCANCWHLRMANRHAKNPMLSPYAQDAATGYAPYLDEEELMEPLRKKRSARIAVQLMGDLFHEIVMDAWIAKIFSVMGQSEEHTFQILTKRPERMMAMFHSVAWAAYKPLPNVWLGVSVENQETADERIPLLLQTPAAVRFASVEPMLAAMNLGPWLKYGLESWEEGHPESPYPKWPGGYSRRFPRIDWIICGSETGPRKRPCKPEWIDSLREQCKQSGVQFFGKVDSDGMPISPRQYPK